MSYEDGWAAVNLEMPPRVPRYEPSAEWYHIPLINAATGLNISLDSSVEERQAAAAEFVRAWDYGIMLACKSPDLSAKNTSMGHAEYALDGVDFYDKLYCPFKSVEEVYNLDFYEVYGTLDHTELVESYTAHYRDMCETFTDCVNMSGIYATLMSGMIEIFGWDMLLTAAGTDPVRFGEVVNRYAEWNLQHYRALGESETSVVYCHDDIVWTEGPFMQPAWYRKYIFPNIKKLWEPLVDSGKKVIYCCDGNYTPFLDDIVACGNSGFWFEIFTDLEEVVQRYGKTHVIIGNGDCRILTFGSKAGIRAEVERCMALGKSCPGYIMCISGHIPANVPVENALYYDKVYRELRVR